jgi:hypothetical protein
MFLMVLVTRLFFMVFKRLMMFGLVFSPPDAGIQNGSCKNKKKNFFHAANLIFLDNK